MAATDDIRSTLDVDQIAQFLGTDRDTASRVLDEALESLVGTMDAQVADPSAAAGLGRALDDHVGSGAFAERVDINTLDARDGEKIVGHVYSGDQIQALGGQGAAGGLLRKLLPLLAPIVMNYLARRLQDHLGGGRTPAPPADRPAPAPAPRPGQPSGGGFAPQAPPPTDIDLGQTPEAAPTPGGAGAPAGGAGDLLGGILSDLLRGRR